MQNDFRHKLGTLPMILIFGTVYLISQIIIGIILNPLNPILFFKAQTTFSPEVLLDLIGRWEAADLMANYRRHFYLDFVHPVWYAVFLGALLAKGLVLNDSPAKWNAMLGIPFLAGMLDLVENVFHLWFINDLSAVTQGTVFVSALAANLKWGLAAVSIVLAVLLYVGYFAGFGERRNA